MSFNPGNKIYGALWVRVLEKAWKIDTKIFLKSLIGNITEFENDGKLNREPMKWFQEWHRMRKLRKSFNNTT